MYDPFFQAYFGSIVIVISIILQVSFNPFSEKWLNRLESVSLFSTMCTQMGDLFQAGHPDEARAFHQKLEESNLCFDTECIGILHTREQPHPKSLRRPSAGEAAP